MNSRYMNGKTPRFEIFHDRDLVELERMALALYREDSYGEKMSRRKIGRTVRELSLQPSRGSIILFRIGEAVVGYAIVIYYWSNEYGGEIVFIDELFVKPRWRRKGIGSSFIEHVATMKARCLKGLQVEVTPLNERAFGFYSQRGFSPSKNRYLFKRLHKK